MTDIAYGKTTTASSTYSGYPSSNAVDGNASTYWSSEFSDPQWIKVDLGDTYDITAVTIVWESAYGKAYTVDVSADDSIWDSLYSETNGSGGTVSLTNLLGWGRYIRIYGTQRGTAWGYGVKSFEVDGTQSGTPPVPNARLTQELVETVSACAPSARSTQVVVEMVSENVPDDVIGGARPQLFIIT